MTTKNENILNKTYEMKTKIGKTSKTNTKRITIPTVLVELLNLDEKEYAKWIFSITEEGLEIKIEFE